MAKRFTDTSKYRNPFIRALPPAYKLLWDYITNECDHAGIWIVDFEVANIILGLPVTRDQALNHFNSNTEQPRIIEIDRGEKWFIRPFVEFQYGELKDNNPAHRAVIRILKSKNLLDPIKPLQSPLKGAMDMDKDKEMDKDKDMDIGQGQVPVPPKAILHEYLAIYYELFPESIKDPSEDIPAIGQISRLLRSLAKDAGMPEGEVPEQWRAILEAIRGNKFWAAKSLKSWASNFQTIINEIRTAKSDPPKPGSGHKRNITILAEQIIQSDSGS